MGVGVEDAHDVGPERLGGAVHPQHLLGVDLVDHGRGGGVGRDEEVGRLVAPVGPGQEAARLVGQAGQAVGDHLHVEGTGQAEHG